MGGILNEPEPSHTARTVISFVDVQPLQRFNKQATQEYQFIFRKQNGELIASKPCSFEILSNPETSSLWEGFPSARQRYRNVCNNNKKNDFHGQQIEFIITIFTLFIVKLK